MPVDEVAFVCNICGIENTAPPSVFDRESASCPHCNSTVRTRAIVQMISRELLGADLPLPQFPKLKSIRGIGISDSPDYANRLGEKFDYRNTFYHKAPQFDIVHPPEEEFGSYDFLIASEVFEHVAPPVDIAFENAFRLLKPNGVFFFTVPYTLDEHTAEHFPALHDYGIAQLSDRMVMVNRTREGQLQMFDDLVFHGGGGSTLEIRRFSENDLRAQFERAGFVSLKIYGENYAPFGVLRPENWSLPMTARKQPFQIGLDGISALMDHWIEMSKRVRLLESRVTEYQELLDSMNRRTTEELEARTKWALDLERQLSERTEWTTILQKDVAHHTELAEQFQAESAKTAEEARHLETRLEDLRRQLEVLNRKPWTRAGRAIGLV